MRRLLQTAVVFSLVVYGCGHCLFASEADELRQKAKALQKEAAALAEQGRPDAAEEHARQAVKLLEEAERHEAHAAQGKAEAEHRPDLERAIDEHRERIHHLAKEREQLEGAGAPREQLERLADVIGQAKHQLQALEIKRKGSAVAHRAAREFDPNVKRKLEEAGRRIKHLRVAADNLRAAGAEDLAHDLAEKAEALEREARAAKEEFAARAAERPDKHHPELAKLHAQMRELREENERLRAEVKELRGQLDRP